MAGYWTRSFYLVHKHAKNERGQYLDSHVDKTLVKTGFSSYMEKLHSQSCGTQQVIPSRQDSKTHHY